MKMKAVLRVLLVWCTLDWTLTRITVLCSGYCHNSLFRCHHGSRAWCKGNTTNINPIQGEGTITPALFMFKNDG